MKPTFNKTELNNSYFWEFIDYCETSKVIPTTLVYYKYILTTYQYKKPFKTFESKLNDITLGALESVSEAFIMEKMSTNRSIEGLKFMLMAYFGKDEVKKDVVEVQINLENNKVEL